MTTRLDRLVREAVSKGADVIASVRRQAPAARFIGKFTVDHLVQRIRGNQGPSGEASAPGTDQPET